ncbi:MAG: DNA mismatch repair protein MutS [Clostridia bacterium]|nr:DNA mismatch repair protein MutS [Clostridia bacterium]
MMRQYLEVKEQYKDSILFFRLGDFYEMFYDDAKLVSRELELTLTGKDCGEPERAPMCGIPYHAAETYIGRLIAKGYKVVICEQTEDPATAKGLVKRDVTRIITPGTVIGNIVPSETKNNYLCAVNIYGGRIGLAFADISTGDLSATMLEGEGCIEKLLNELGKYQPSEIIMNINRYDLPKLSMFLSERLPDTFVTDKIDSLFREENLIPIKDSIDPEVYRKLTDNKETAAAVGALTEYISDTQKTELTYIKSLNFYVDGQFMEIDVNTRRNLELTETMRSRDKRGSLLNILDKTKTSMGARLLRKWLEAPLVNVNRINRRLSAVEELYSDMLLRGELGELLKGIYDLERLTSRVSYGTANARDLRSISLTLAKLPDIKRMLEGSKSEILSSIHSSLDELPDIYSLINNAICDEPPFSVREGGFIRKGFSAEVDTLAEIMDNGGEYIKSIEKRERERTGIPKLKIGYNRVFGYYIEISKSYTEQAPEDYIRRQTLTNGERYITEELKDLESKILGASDKRNALEYEIFSGICDEISKTENVRRIQQTAADLSALDVLISLADVAQKNGYVRPEVDLGEEISIKEGRHPVVERMSADGYFVANDTLLDTEHNRMLIITGPNMAGKSTFMRQVALITVMAQMGSFVPAEEARIGVCDKIFTRVGASDDLAAGQSTFMLEMTEVAYILKNATRRSLIIYDEIGRGTSTFDGMSIACAVLEYTAGKKIGAKTLFATHYHELTDLEGKVDGVKNYYISAKKKDNDIIFLRKIVRGAADDSYGIEVAGLAGVPKEVIRRAKKELARLLEENSRPKEIRQKEENENISLEDIAKEDVISKIKNLDIDSLTPLEAMKCLYELKGML